MRRLTTRTGLMMTVFAMLAVLPISVSNAAPVTRISAERTSEDGVDLLVATVTVDGKPIEGAVVQARIRRTFGQLPLGQEKTLDDGTAYIELPKTLPPSTTGRLDVTVSVVATQNYPSAQASVVLSGVPVIATDQPGPAPRALWAYHAPWGLLGTIIVLLGGVWFVYGIVVYQVCQLKKGSHR